MPPVAALTAAIWKPNLGHVVEELDADRTMLYAVPGVYEVTVAPPVVLSAMVGVNVLVWLWQLQPVAGVDAPVPSQPEPIAPPLELLDRVRYSPNPIRGRRIHVFFILF